VLAGDENPHRPLIDIVGGQLGVPVDVWELYAERDATRRSHLLELLPRLGMEQFGTRHYRSISACSIRQLSKRRAGLFSRKPL
jgi:hypothetical protein